MWEEITHNLEGHQYDASPINLCINYIHNIMSTNQSKLTPIIPAQLEKDLEKAQKAGESTFTHSGRLISTAFAPYLIKYAKLKQQRKRAN